MVNWASTAISRSIDRLKQDLLLFDHLQIMGLHQTLTGHDFFNGDLYFDAEDRRIHMERSQKSVLLGKPLFRRNPSLAADCEYLIEQGAISPYPLALKEFEAHLRNLYLTLGDIDIDIKEKLAVLGSSMRHPSGFGPEIWDSFEEFKLDDLIKKMEHLRDELMKNRRIKKKFKQKLLQGICEPLEMLYDAADQPIELGAEYFATYVENAIIPGSKVPLLRRPLSTLESSFLNSSLPSTINSQNTLQRLNNVVDVVISKLPVPGDDVPLEAVLQFARDEETRMKIQALRMWMLNAPKVTQNVEELSLEVDSMLLDLKQHLKAAKMNPSSGPLALTVGIPLEIAEELAHFRPKRALEAAFNFRQRKAALLEAELASKGREISYIYYANQQFK